MNAIRAFARSLDRTEVVLFAGIAALVVGLIVAVLVFGIKDDPNCSTVVGTGIGTNGVPVVTTGVACR